MERVQFEQEQVIISDYLPCILVSNRSGPQQMLPELKDLVQKGLFSDVRVSYCILFLHAHKFSPERNKAHNEKADYIRNESGSSCDEKVRFSAVHRLRNEPGSSTTEKSCSTQYV